MSPKDKAYNLCLIYSNELKDYGNITEQVKKCALVCIGAFLSFQDNLYITEGSLAYQYWLDVKQEINKL